MKVLCLLAALVAAEVEVEEGVLVGTADNFDGIIADNKFVLVEFYAPWCGHCKALAPEYEKAAKELESNEDVKLVKVDATIHSDLAQQFEVGGYPTLKFFKNGDKGGMEYGGGRTADEIVSWINKKSGPPAINIEGADAAKAALEANDVIVATFAADTSVFISVADSYDDVTFATLDEAAAKELSVEADQISIFKKFDDGRANYEGEANKDDILAFIKLESLPLVNEFNEETAPKIFGGDIMQHLLLFAAKSSGSFETERAAFGEAAKSHKGSTLFVLVDCDEDDNGRVLEFFGLKQDDCAAVRLIQMGEGMSKFKPESDDLTADNFNAFIKGVESGEIKKHLMSEEVPEKNDEAVFVIVGKNYEETVYDENKAVLVEFYAPWCGHCKSLEPTYKKLGEHFKDDDSIIIAKSDATANEFEDVEVQGFPTIKYYPKGPEREVIDYEGGRDLDALIKFVESGGTEGNEASEDDEDYDDEDYDEDEDDEDYDDEEDDGHDEL